MHVHAEDEPAGCGLAVAEVAAVARDDALVEEGVAQAELVEQLERPRPERARPPVDRRVRLVLLVCTLMCIVSWPGPGWSTVTGERGAYR